MIDITNVSRRFGTKAALTDVSFSAPDGSVTGFVGPNGAGKSTLLRIATGLDRPDAGVVAIDGVEQAPGEPRRNVGALLDASWTHPRRTAYDHLLALALLQGLPASRVGEVLEVTGLAAVAKRRIGQFSLGMRQRLGIAVALLDRPTNVILDEPINGLDPDGITWVRCLARDLADQGAAVLMSSHLLAELAQTADRIVVIGRGRIVGAGPIEEFVRTISPNIDAGPLNESLYHADINPAISAHLKDILYDIAAEYGFTISHLEVGLDDHIHLMVSAPPKLSVTNIVRWLKGTSARLLFLEFPELKKSYWKKEDRHLWAPSYFVESIGTTNEHAIAKYIDDQRRKEGQPDGIERHQN